MPHLEAGDIIIDGGNSHFADTQRRYEELTAKNIRFVGSGVSGGEEGALKGPSLMPGFFFFSFSFLFFSFFFFFFFFPHPFCFFFLFFFFLTSFIF